MNKLSFNRLRVSTLTLSVLIFLVFLFVPSELFFNNYREFSFSYSDISIWIISLWLSTTLLLASVLQRVSLKIDKYMSSLFISVVLLLWFEGYFIQPDFGPLDGRIIDWSKWNLTKYIDVLLWIVVIISSIYFNNSIYKYTRSACFIIFITLSSTSLYYFSQYSPEKNTQFQFDYDYIPNFSKKENIIVIILDELQSDIFYELLKENSVIEKVFRGFTYYPDTVSGYAWTVPSIPLILTGKYYDNSVSFTEEYINKSYLESSLTKDLAEIGYRVELFPKFVDFNYYKSKEIADNVIRKGKSKNFKDVEKNIKNIIALALFKISPYVFKKHLYENHVFPNSITKKNTTWSHLDYWSQDIQFITNLEANSDVIYNEPVFKLFHLRGAHVPWWYDPEGNIVPATGSRKNYKNHVLHSLKIVSDILKKIYELGIYNNSLIYILSDHGAGRSKETRIINDVLHNKISDNLHEETSIPYQIKARAIPLFMKKPFNSTGPLTISDMEVSTSGFKNIILNDLGLTSQNSNNLDHGSETRKYFYYAESKDMLKGDVQDLLEYNITGNSWLDSSWNGPDRVHSSNRQKYKNIIGFELSKHLTCLNNINQNAKNKIFDFYLLRNNEYNLSLKSKIKDEFILGIFHNFKDEISNSVDIYVNENKVGSLQSKDIEDKIFRPYKLIYLNKEDLNSDNTIDIKLRINSINKQCLSKSVNSIYIFELERTPINTTL